MGKDIFLVPENLDYISDLYQKYLTDPSSLSTEWLTYFKELDPTAGVSSSAVTCASSDDIRRSIGALMLVRAFRVRGHLQANLDPLQLEKRLSHSELDPKHYGFKEDMDMPIFLNFVLGREIATLRELIYILNNIYCRYIGFEFMHIQNPEEKAWLQERIEANLPYQLDRKSILEQILKAEEFEKFLNVKFPGAKRFGLDGNESCINSIEAMIEDSAKDGAREIVIGMAHRGRLNVLANIMKKPLRIIFAEFMGEKTLPDDFEGTGDVKYHMGYSSDRKEIDMHLSLTANPSHLEVVNPVVLGKVRAKQDMKDDHLHKKVMSILLHGDAAFAGQGLTAETLCLSGLKGYEVGGTIHLITNNQIGFTTSPPLSRSSPYSSGVAKGIQAPIIHVNGDHPEEVVKVTKLAIAYERKFGKDVVIDVVGYRRYGHNEGDEPMFTQPIMYKAIKAHPTIGKIYTEKLLNDNLLSKEEVENVQKKIKEELHEEFKKAKNLHKNEKKLDWLDGKWKGITKKSLDFASKKSSYPKKTGLTKKEIQDLGVKLTEIPPQLNVNRKIFKFLEERRVSIESGNNINWATAESLAFASILTEGIPVRLSGQDSGRGTFSQRHAVIVDQENEDKFIPLNHLGKQQASFDVIDSPLAEASVMGFEYGYSSANPNALVLWEGQFGDFANGAQVIIDQFICSAEAKWLRMSGLVLLLPHGMEGQGPEHSSARLERYLQLCAEDNMQVVNMVSPANYFHALRRQIITPWRKPLIVMTPKSLLRNKLAVSTISEFSGDFRKVIDSDDVKNAKRVVLCSGKVYYDLITYRDSNKIKGVSIIAVEQLYPFAKDELSQIIQKHTKADFIWCQEETANNGAWQFIKNRLDLLLKTHNAEKPVVEYAGRKSAASPATGLPGKHEFEQNLLVEQALGIKLLPTQEDIYG